MLVAFLISSIKNKKYIKSLKYLLTIYVIDDTIENIVGIEKEFINYGTEHCHSWRTSDYRSRSRGIHSQPSERTAVHASHPDFRKQCEEQLIAVYAFAKYGEEEKTDETEEFKNVMENARKDIPGRWLW